MCNGRHTQAGCNAPSFTATGKKATHLMERCGATAVRPAQPEGAEGGCWGSEICTGRQCRHLARSRRAWASVVGCRRVQPLSTPPARWRRCCDHASRRPEAGQGVLAEQLHASEACAPQHRGVATQQWKLACARVVLASRGRVKTLSCGCKWTAEGDWVANLAG